MRVSRLVHEFECLGGKPRPPVQFRENNDQRKQESLRQDKICPEIGKDRSIIENNVMRNLHSHDHPKTIGQKSAYVRMPQPPVPAAKT